MRKIDIALLLTVLANALFLSGCKDKEIEQIPPKTVVWQILEKDPGTFSRELSGVLQPAHMAELSFEVSGKIDNVNVELGEAFQKGAVLAILDKTIYTLTVEQRKGELSEARARLQETENDYRRKKRLLKDGAVSKSVYDVAKSQYESTKDQVAVARSRLSIAEEDLEDTQLIAPYDGSVSRRHIEPAQRITAGMTAFEIQGNTFLEISLSVPETIIGQLKVGQESMVTFPALPSFEYTKATITEIGTQADMANAFPVILSLPEQSRDLKPGMTAEVSFVLGDPDKKGEGFRVPVTAISAANDQNHFVFKIVENEDASFLKLQRTAVNIQDLRGDEVLIQGELLAGERIVRAGLAFLQDGQMVSLKGENTVIYNE